ncbi:MAG: hypothetical protein K0Q72_897 [Armatimonadetes bacterium]|nr:hypothetical protein [Armatimonadota bacterium]
MTRSMVRMVAMGAAVLLLGGMEPPAQAQAGRKTFGGKVLKSHAAAGWFVMKGGASKKYAQVRINFDKKTRWGGVPLKGRSLREGDPVQVIGVPAGDGAFRALTVDLQDPNAQPGGSRTKAGGLGK